MLGGAYVGQGLCPGMPGYVPHPIPEPIYLPDPAPAPAPLPEPAATAPAPAPATTTVHLTARAAPSVQPTAVRERAAARPNRAAVRVESQPAAVESAPDEDNCITQGVLARLLPACW